MNCKLPQITRETIDVVKNLGERFAIDYYRKNNLSNFASFKDMMNNNSILFSEAKLLEVVEKFLPKNSFQVKHLNNIIQNLPADSQAAFFKDVLYFGDNVTKEQIAEETFHAIFQRVIPNSLRDKYLEEGRSLIENIEKSKKDYLEDYPKASLLNEKQLEERVIEEAIAKKYVEYFNNNISPSNKKGILKLLDNFFKWLKDLFNNLRNGDNLEILFNNILKGKFTKSTIQNTNESEVPTLRLITYMGKDMNGSDEQKNLTVKESEFLISALGSIVIGLNNLKVETLQKLNLTNRARRIQFAIEKLREVYAKEGKNNNPKFVSALSQHTTKVLNKEATSIKDRIIKTELPNLKNLAEDVNNYLNIVTGVEIKNAEIDEDEVAEVNYGDMIAANERGFEGMSAWLRSYIATTGSFEDSFEVEGESVDILRPIDKNKVYYSLARSMQNTTHELERLYKLVTIGSFNTNTETRLLIDRVIKDVMNYNLSDENERFKKFKEDVTSLYNTWKSNKKKHHYIINTLPNFNKEKSYILQTILQGFDLWKRDNYKVELEFKSGTYHTKVYEANQNSASKVQLEMWQNKWEETIANPQEKARVRKILESYARKIDSLIDNKTITKANLDDILNTIFYDVDDSYLTYLLDSDTNNSLGGTFTGTATLEDVKKIFEIALKETDTNNKESNLFLSGNKGARARIEKFAVNVSKINEKVIESTYKDAENKTRYSYQNKTFQLYMFNEIFNMNNIDYYLGNIMEKQMYEYAEGKFLEQASTFLYKGENNSLNHIIFSDDLWKKSFVNGDFYSVDGLDGGVGSSTFGGMTNRDFLLWKLHLKAFKTKGVNKDNSGNFEYFTQPIHINLMEAKRTASFKEVRVIEGLFKDGEITDLAIDLFGKEIKKEVYRMYEEKSKILNWLKILAKDLEDGEHVIKLERKNVIAKGKVSDGEGIIEKYHTGEYKIEKKENDIKIISGGGRALQFTDNVKNLLSKETYNSIISNVFITESIDKNTVIPTISRELKSQLNEYIKEYESVIKELRGVLPSSSDTRYKNLNEIVNGKNFNRDGFLNDELSSWLNTTWVNQLINSDSALLVKNDGADFVKRAGGQNAAIASLSTTFYSDKLKGINKFDKIKYIVGNDPQGIISFKTDEKVDSADAQSYMTVDAYLKYLHSTSKLTSESSEILFKIKDGIPLTEKDRKYLKENDIFFNVIKPVGYDGYFYFKTGTVMLTKNMTSILVIKDGKEVWIAKPGREALHNLREKMEATGVDYYLGQTASKQLTINKYTEDFDNIRFNGKEEIDEIWNGSTNVMSTKFFGQQMENPAGKEKIIDPSQMLEIILNEQELNGATFDIMLNGQKFPIGEILKKWQALSINRVSLTFQEAMNEIADDNLIIQSDKFIKKVQDVLASSGADDQLLEIFSLDKDGKPLYNLNMSVSVDKFINLLMSHFTKGVFQQKVAGDAMALISPHGMNVIKKIIKHETIDGKIVYSWKVIRESDPEYNKALNSKLHRLENIAEYDEFDNKSQLKGGSSELINTLASLYDENKDVYFVDQLRFGKPVYTFNEDGLVEGVEYYGAEAILPKHKEGINVDELNKMFGLRIPSQDKQSAVNLIWVDELASYYGNTISVPKEIQYLSGSDYDIDKLYIHRKETFEKDGKEIVWGIEHNTFEMYKYYHTTGNSLVRKRIKELIKEDEYLPKLKIKLNSILKELEDFKEDPELYTLSFYTKDIVEKINNSDEEEQEKYYEELEKIQNQFDNLDANLKSAKILELEALIKSSKDSVKDGINYVKDVLTGIAFKEFKLITKEKEFNERKEKEGILILPIINNEMLELKLRLLTNDATLDRSKGEAVSLTPATQDNLKKFIAKTYIIENGKPFYLFKTKKGDDEFTTEIKHATHSTLGQHIAHKNVVTGKRNIGVAVVANLLHLFSKKANIVVYKDVLIEDVTPSLSKNDGLHELVEHRLSKFNISRNVKDQRIADIISELISAATDEVKDQQNAKYGLTMEALNIVTPILMLGGSLDFAIRLINTSSVREYLNKVSMKDNIVKTEDEKSELQASNETILNNLLGGYIPSEKPLSIVDLKKGVANKEALAFASKMLAISREIGMANYVIGLKKGLKKTIEEFEDGESKIESTTKEKPNPLQMTNMSLVFKQENENLEIYQEQIKLHKILSEFFNNNIVSRKNQFQILKYHFINNFKPATYDEARKWVNDNMVSFIYSRLYFNYLDKRLNLNDDKFEEYTKAKLEDVEKEWTDFVNKIKSKDSSLGISNELIEDISKNPLITKLKKNTKGRIYAPTFIKSDIATNVSLLESFYDLHMKLINTDESLGYNNLMWKLFHYSVHKDGWTFKGGSLSKVIPPVFFTSHSKSLDEFVKNPSTYNGEYSNGYLAYIAIERAMQTKDGTSYIKEANRKDDDLWGRLFKNETISLETIENLKQQDQTWLLDRGYIVADVKGNIFPQFPLYHKFRIPKTDGSGKLESVIHRMEKLNVLFDDKITREITPQQYFDNINRVEKVLKIKYKIWSNIIKKENIDENMINLPIRKGIKIEKLDIGERVEEKQISSQQSTDANKGIQQSVNINIKSIKELQNNPDFKPLNITGRSGGAVKDTAKMKLGNKLISFGEKGSSTWYYQQDAGVNHNPQTYSSNDIINISVNGNSRANQKENVEKTKQEILKAIQQGVNYFVADEMNYAKQGFNSNGEGEIARWFMEDVNGKIANVEYKSALNNQAGIYKVVLLQQPVNTNLATQQPSTKKDFIRVKGYFVLSEYKQGYDGSFLNYKVYNSNNEKLFYVYKDDSRIDIPDIIFREFNLKGINISKDDVEDMIENVDKNNEIYKELKQSEKQTDKNQPDITKQQQKIPLDVVQDNVLFDSSLPKVNIYAGTGENADLSNFAIRPFVPNATKAILGESTTIKFNTVEGAFQAAKVFYTNNLSKEDEDFNKSILGKLQTATGKEAKSLGKQIKGLNSSEWDKVSSNIMKDLISASFEQNPEGLQKLLATGKSELTHKYNNAEQDKGRFSKLLMEVRQELTQQQQETLLNVSEKIYSQLGNKTQSENVVIKPWDELKNVVKAITPQNIISTRIKNSNEHFGNPFSHDSAGKTQGLIKTETVKEAVERYIDLVINSQDNFYTGKITPSKDTIFVFGSNPEGRHGLGAAKIAKEQFGAIYGQGEGLQGNAYALPTKDLRVKDNNSLKSIDENTIINSIKKLYEVAKQNPTKQFKIAYTNTTEKSLNGYTGLEIINMFNQAGIAPNNIVFSEEWHNTGKLLNSRAQWIREQLKSGKLKDKPIVYYKELGEPSHATALDYLINKYDWNQIPIDIEQQKKTEPQIDSLPWENKDSLTDIKQKSKDEPYLIFSKDGVDYYMNDQQKAAFDFLVENIKKRMENNPPVYGNSFEDRMIFESPLTKSFSNIIPKELYNNMFGLQGFGGTGKTTISKKLLAALSNSDNVFSGKTVEFVAPTHIASTQLQEALEVDSEGIEKVSTIAKYLRLEPKGNQITEEGFVPRTEGDYIKTYRYMTPVGSPDIIVIDESSMLGTDDMKLFIQRMITDYNQGVMREFPIMLFLGDYHQLPPIESSKDNQNKLGIISSLILKNKQKSPVLTQVMRSDDKELADLYLSVANQIDKYLDSVEKGENYEMSASDFKDFLKRDNTNILSVTGNTPKSIEALIDEYVDYLVKNDYPDGMFWLHYNRLGNSDTQDMLRKIRLKYLQKFDKNLKILPDNYIKNDYVTADVGLPFYTPLLKIPDNIIPKDSLFYKLNKSDNLKNGIRIISEGIIKPKSRYKIIEQIVNRPISLEELQEAFNGEEGSFFNDKNIKRVFKGAKVDIDLLYNRQKRIRGLFSFTNIVLEKQEVYYSDVRKDGSRSKLGLEYFFYNTDTKEIGSFKVLFNDKEKFQTILATIKDENNKDKRNKGTKIFSPSYIGSSHSYQGAGINNVVGDSTNVLKYLGKGGIHQLDIMASLYTIITRTKNRLIVIGNESGYNAKNWSGLKMDEQPSAEKDKLPNDTLPFDDTNFMDLTNDNPPSCV